MASVLEEIMLFQHKLNKYVKLGRNDRVLYYIHKLKHLPVTVNHLEITGVGKTVNSLRHEAGPVGEKSRELVEKWKQMVNDEQEEQEVENECEDDSIDMTIAETTNAESHISPYKVSVQEDEDEDDDSSSQNLQIEDVEIPPSYRSNLDDSHDDTDEGNCYNPFTSRVDYQSVVNSTDSGDVPDYTPASKEPDPIEDIQHAESFPVEKHKRKKNKKDKDNVDGHHRTSSHDRKKEKDTKGHSHDKAYSKSKDKKKDKHEKRSHKEHKSDNSKHQKAKTSDSYMKHENKSEEYAAKRHHSKKDSLTKANGIHDRSVLKDALSPSTLDDVLGKSGHSSHNFHDHDKKLKGHYKSKTHDTFISGNNHSPDFTLKATYNDDSSKKKKSKTERMTPGVFEQALLDTPSSTKKKKKKHSKEERKQVKRPCDESYPGSKKANSSSQTFSSLSLAENKSDLDESAGDLQLPEITPNYKPLPQVPVREDHHRLKMTDEEALNKMFSGRLTKRSKIYSGKIYGMTSVPSLYELCICVLQENIDSIENTGIVPFYILRPVLERATPEQLFNLENYNPYLLDDTDCLWEFHCKKRFKNMECEEMETWRDMYIRCSDQRSQKLISLTNSIQTKFREKNQPVRTTQLVNDLSKVPKKVARAQAKYGTGIIQTKPGKASEITARKIAMNNADRVEKAAPLPAKAQAKKTTAPLMKKSINFYKKAFRR